MSRIMVLALGVVIAVSLATDAEAKNPIRRDFFDYYTSAQGTQLDALPSNGSHCGMCHYDFNGGGARNWYGSRLEALRAGGSTNEAAFALMETENADGDAYDNITEISDTVNFPNTPTFPGLASGDLGAVVNIPLAEVSPYVTPTTAVDNDPPVVTVTSPVGGEVFAANQTVIVTWTVTDASPITTVLIEHSEDGGLTWKAASFGEEDDGNYDWFVPARPGTQNVIRVRATDEAGNEGHGDSPSSFEILPVTGGRLPTSLRDVDLPGTQPFGGPVLADPDDNCALCHGNYDTAHEMWANWRGSMMAQAARDPLFYACLAVTEQDAPGVGDLCIRCHSPRGWLAGRSIDTSGESLTEADRKGISCDFCHKLVDWNYVEGVSPAEDADILAALDDPPTEYTSGQYVMAPSAPKRGPYADALDTGHPILDSAFHRSSDLCGTCHDVSNPAFDKVGEGDYAPNTFDAPHPTMVQAQMGPVERTYSEWKASDFANGGVDLPRYGGVVSTCQDCHMSDVTAAGANVEGAPVRTDLPLHDMTGGNTAVQAMIAAAYPDETDAAQLDSSIARARRTLSKALDLEVTPTIDGIDVRVTNQTGHKLPTGYPEGRRIFIQVEGRNAQDEVIFTSGAYDFSTGVLTYDPQIKIYEIKPGFSPALASALGLPAGPSFHFVLNDSTYKDNRIPPRGFTNAAFVDMQMPPVDHTYADGQYWDDTHYVLSHEVLSATVRVYYQAVSKDYVDFLLAENTTNDAGQTLYDLWNANEKGAPELMAEATVAVNSVTSVEPSEPAVVFALGRLAPNPFGASTRFEFSLPEPVHVDLAVFDARGRRVRVLENEIRPAGRYTMQFDGRDDRGADLATGVYYLRLQAGAQSATERVVLMR